MQRFALMAPVDFKASVADLLKDGQYEAARDACLDWIDHGGPDAYLGYLWRAAAWLRSGEHLGPGLYNLIDKACDLAGDAVARRADCLYMALGVYLDVAGRRLFDSKAAELLELARTEPEAERYTPGTLQLLGWSALSRQEWGRALDCFDAAANNLHKSARVEMERCMIYANRAIALLGMGSYAAAESQAESGLLMRYEYGCLSFELACLAAQADMFLGRPVDVPPLRRPEKAANIHYLVTCGVALACGYASPEADPVAQLNAVIEKNRTYVYAGLADWVAGHTAAKGGGLS